MSPLEQRGPESSYSRVGGEAHRLDVQPLGASACQPGYECQLHRADEAAVDVTHRCEVLMRITGDLPERQKVWIQPVHFSTGPEDVICQKGHQVRHVGLG